ncbi:Coenzyme F420 hydrogenase/dehydrogenase, beta subunit C-terminal domain [Fibrobacter sp. UWR2]|uniref:Coenzyme F420 hydrogenase/dehydrogenase, beta subunit C-terminal domain n=1 Tax=Fibrobacter sp. UWR2 TaxID=1964352 RepID=UPI000B523E77|nr:Coenzyme F420 hydrogenase/dehydrogenase, beta subunit C-terminal domain [Fibrobacter sp. UWR2]OWU99942.1 hypothetical protein B7994_09735 [Fibrobacter sp. UWR2]
MIELFDKKKCCGCGACMQICPKNCITMRADNEGFLYPMVDTSVCVQCGACEKVCPFNSVYEQQKPISTYGVINTNEQIRLTSSSGGAFTALARTILRQNGVVFGACFDKDYQVVIAYAEDEDSLEAFKGSKYVQARVGESFSKCKCFLNQNKIVLFSGTPCQISGLKHFLKRDYDNLYTIDVVCHGAPSPMVWETYLNWCKRQNLGLSSIRNIFFRDKCSGWKGFSFTIKGQNCTLSTPYKYNPYMKAFLWDVILRPSCYECKAKAGASHADLTLGDFWGVDRIMPSVDDNKGVSLVLANSIKGKELLNKTVELNVFDTDYDKAVYYNPAIVNPVKPHPKRNYFFKNFNSTDSFENLVEKCLKPSLNEKCVDALKRIYHKLLKRK